MNRAAGERGVCGADNTLRVARAALHCWEEPLISVGAGSGTVFFSGCPLRCCYCQNAPISMGGVGAVISVERLSEIFLELQGREHAANINLVTPTHYAPQVAAALRQARAAGLRVPVVCNTSGYESLEALALLDGLIDVYLTDFKYAPARLSGAAAAYSHAPDYHEHALIALDEMLRQVGEPVLGQYGGDAQGRCAGSPVLARGVVVRHMLLPGPGALDASKQVVSELWERYGTRVLYSFMGQYTPVARFPRHPELDDPTTPEDYEALLCHADDLGMDDYFWQEGQAAAESFIPAWDLHGVLEHG